MLYGDYGVIDWSGVIQEARKPNEINVEACVKAWRGLEGRGRSGTVKNIFLSVPVSVLFPSTKFKGAGALGF